MPQQIELRTVACRDSHDLYMGRTAIQFLTPHAPWFSDAPSEVVLPLIMVSCLLKGRGPLNNFLKSAETLRKIRPIDGYHSHPPSRAIRQYL